MNENDKYTNHQVNKVYFELFKLDIAEEWTDKSLKMNKTFHGLRFVHIDK